MNMAYFYKIQHVPSGSLYVGCRYAANCIPSELLVEYFTSSKKVKAIIENEGVGVFKIISVKVREDARDYEARYLKRMFRKFGNEKFKEVFLNRNIAPGILNDADSLARASLKKKISNSLSQYKLLNEGRHNWQNLTDEQKQRWSEKSSLSKMGNDYGKYRNITDEYRKTAAEKSKGNTNVRGTTWWTDGVVFKRSIHKPGESYYKGSPSTKKKVNNDKN
jgi:hypothetical protein